MNRNDSPPQELGPGLFMNYKSEDAEAHWFHAHRGIEMLYIYSGHGEIMAENETYPIRDHTLVWFQPYQLHRVQVPQEQGRSYLRTNLTFDPGFMEHYLSAFPHMDKFFRSMWKGSLLRPVMYDMQNTRIPELLEELHQYMSSSAGDTEEQAGFLLLQLIRLLQQHMSGVLAEAPSSSHAGDHMSGGLPNGWTRITGSPSVWKHSPPACICPLTTSPMSSSSMPALPSPAILCSGGSVKPASCLPIRASPSEKSPWRSAASPLLLQPDVQEA